jgi:hypothetical protein
MPTQDLSRYPLTVPLLLETVLPTLELVARKNAFL